MTTTLSAVPMYVKSKVQFYFGDNSLLSRALNIPRSFVNMVLVFPVKNSLTSKAYGYTAWIWSKVWRSGSWRSCTDKSSSKEEEMGNSERNAMETETLLRDFTATNLSSSTIRALYLYFLEHNYLGITKESLELLRDDSKFLQGVQDFELRTVLESLFGCLPKDEACENDTDNFPSAKELFWRASSVVWRTFLNRIDYMPFISWILPENKNVLDQKVSTTEHLPQVNDPTEVCHSPSAPNYTSVTSLLMCEASLLPQVITDSGTYALSTTHNLLKEAVLLFVPMEILANTTELLQNSSLSMTISPLSVFWQLFNYVSIWGVDVVDEMCNQPEINYAVIDDDDFHFVVNVPKMRRPILFIGIR